MTETPAITTDRLRLRRPNRADWPAYATFMQTPQARFFAGHGKPGQAWRSFGTVIWHWIDLGFGPFSVTTKDNDDCIGLVGPKHPVGWPEGEITWIVFGTAEGKGLATEAARAALKHAASVLHWTTAVSYIEDANTRSVALAHRLGARLDPDATSPGPEVQVYRHQMPETGLAA